MPKILLLLLIFILTGCGQPLPSGMPPLYPTTLIITQDNVPLSGATVIAVHEDFASMPYPSGGTTDASGAVELKTNGKFHGVPAGKYIVTVSKLDSDIAIAPDAADTLSPEEYEKLRDKREAHFFYVTERKFTRRETSPLRIEVKSGAKTHSLDVGPPVRPKAKTGAPA
jgi:hypothetical protein